MNINDRPTYVGDIFILTFLKADDNPLAIYSGDTAKVIGFRREIKPVLGHHVNALTREPGIYETLGDPIVKLENGKVFQLPLLNLVPLEYSFNDPILKNELYRREKRKFKYLRPLPTIAYNIGDIVLISQHLGLPEDTVAEILDIDLKPNGLQYIIERNGKAHSVLSDNVIDLMERGRLSELERMGNYLRSVELSGKRRPTFFDQDDYGFL